MKDIRSTDPAQGVLATLLHSIGGIAWRHDTIYDQFFAHTKNCNYSDTDTSLNNIDLIPISDLLKKGLNLAADLLECDNWACRIVPSTEFPGHLVAKCELVDRKGVVSLHLLQREDAIPIVIVGDTRLVTEYIDAVLLVHSFDIVVENLRPPDGPSHLPWLLIDTQAITVLHRTGCEAPVELVPALLESCTWPARHEGQLRSACVLMTADNTRTTLQATNTQAALARYMSPGMTLKVHLSRADTFDCSKANSNSNLMILIVNK